VILIDQFGCDINAYALGLHGGSSYLTVPAGLGGSSLWLRLRFASLFTHTLCGGSAGQNFCGNGVKFFSTYIIFVGDLNAASCTVFAGRLAEPARGCAPACGGFPAS